ncbi:MAG: lipid-binding SYLF domain-containing protein [Gammaproteobacteria bacterium]|nr:lipid-binding SYLF domain-containing protein [Gammaproteobacteria bacterium]MBU1653882.1 lipid-binding SYLF domain-containing protein [Gammaproteobacteria bacterium]MBU1962594.1 lipid-binding SYLF domain-containing protein [Gammaproteobacteria bacterium]
MKQLFGLLVLLMSLVSAPVSAGAGPDAKMREVIDVFREIQRLPEKSVPPLLMTNAYGVAIIPSVVKVGFVLGGSYGEGVLSVRHADGTWSDPVFVSITGGSVGWQIGAQSSDVVLVFKTRRSVDGVMNGKFTLGADASVAAGPMGRKASAATDEKLKAEIYSYSRSRGLFAGIALDGAAIQIRHRDNERYYRQPHIAASEILDGRVANPPESSRRLRDLLARYSR